MNLLLVDPRELDDRGEAILTGRRATHIRGVLGAAPGQRLRAGIVGGPIGDAEVIDVADGAIRIRFEAAGAPPSPLPIDLVLAVPRPKVLSRVLQAVAAVAVRRVDLVNAWRVDKSYFGSNRLEPERIHEDLLLGAEQGETTHLPAVDVHPRLMSYLDEQHPGTSTQQRKLIAHARGGMDLEVAFPPGSRSPVVLAIGPEGGWIDREVDTFAARGFAVVRLGAAILRVETAVTSALAQLMLLRRLPPDILGI